MNFLRPSFPNREAFNNDKDESPARHQGRGSLLGQHQLIDNDHLQLIFPIKNFFLFGSPLGMFGAVYFEEPYIRSKLPTVDDFYNVFHPSDLVANRLEPLIRHYEYPDKINFGTNRQKLGSFFEVARGVSHMELGEDDEEQPYLFGEDQVLGPVLVPWYKNHGLNRSQ